MANIANISILDGKTPTAEAHVFVPMKSGLDASWKRTGVAGQPAVAMEQILMNVKFSPQANGVNKIDIDLAIPVLEQAASGNQAGYIAPPALAYVNRAKVTVFAHQRSDVAGRRDLRVLLSNLFKDAQVIDAIDNLTPVN